MTPSLWSQWAASTIYHGDLPWQDQQQLREDRGAGPGAGDQQQTAHLDGRLPEGAGAGRAGRESGGEEKIGQIITRLKIISFGIFQADLEVVFHDTGLQTVSGVKLVDGLLQRTYEFNDQCQVYVVRDQEMYTALR